MVEPAALERDGTELVGGAAVNEWMKARSEAEARAFGDAISQAIKDPDPAKRATALAAIDPQGKNGRVGILGLLVASQAEAAGDTATAMTRLKAVADDTSLSPIYRQLAQLKLLMVGGASLPQADRDALLAATTAAGCRNCQAETPTERATTSSSFRLSVSSANMPPNSAAKGKICSATAGARNSASCTMRGVVAIGESPARRISSTKSSVPIRKKNVLKTPTMARAKRFVR